MDNIDSYIRKGIKFDSKKGVKKEELDFQKKRFVYNKSEGILFNKSKERKKTELEEKIIDLSNKYLKDFTESLGLKNIEFPLKEEVLFTNRNWGSGIYTNNDFIMIDNLNFPPSLKIRNIKNIIKHNVTQFKDFEKLSTTIHEILHYSSFNKRTIIKNEIDELSSIEIRTGFDIMKNNKPKRYFRLLNEVTTEMIKDNVLEKNFEDIQSKLNIKNTLWLNKDSYRKLQITLANGYSLSRPIIKKIITQSKIDKEKLFKNYFEGNMVFLKQIEETYGPGSLRILALLGERFPQNEGAVYFDINTPKEKREEIKNKIIQNLPKDEREKIDNHIQKMITAGKEN